MRQFFKFVFASCLGSILALVVIVFFFAMAMGDRSAPPTVDDGSVLHLKLNYPVPELTDNVPQQQFSFSQRNTLGLDNVTRVIAHATGNDKIRGILIQTESVFMNPTTAYAIAEEIESFKESGKWVYAYGDYFNQSGYILASMADSIYLNPNGFVDLRGYGTVSPYFENFSKKTGIEFDVYFAGKYKSAIEPYYRTESSPENRFQTREFLDEYHQALAGHIADRRSLNTEVTDNLIFEGMPPRSDVCVNEGIVDRLLYEEDVKELLKETMDTRKLKLVDPKLYNQVYPKKKSSSPNKIAVVYAEGPVAFAGDDKGNINMKVYDRVFDGLIKNKSIESVVIRVNSPGGSSFTSDKFLKRIKDLQNAGKYVVASFSDYAASGGYYIAASADKIVAEPTTLTGSIGAYSMIPDFNKASVEHLGINWDTVGTGLQTFIYSTFIPRSERENEILQMSTEKTYEQFKKIVAEGRSMSVRQIEEIAQGRVWTGRDAVGVGLVDTLGGIQDAISVAAEEMEYDDYKTLKYPIIKKTFWEQLLENLDNAGAIEVNVEAPLPRIFTEEFRHTLNLIENACFEPQMRLPFHLVVN